MADPELGFPRDTGQAGTRLDRGQIARAAVTLLDTEGAGAFSMRKLAQALNVQSPTLYWHFRNKEQLFELVIDEVLGECALPKGEQPWDQRLLSTGLDLRRVLLTHPAAVQIMPGRVPFGPNGLRLANHIIGVLRDAGFSNRLASYGYLLLMTYVVGFAGQETAFGKGPGNAERLAQVSKYVRDLPPDRYPHLVAVADDLTGRPGMTHRFEVGLTGILAGLDRQRSAPSPTTMASTQTGQPPSGGPPQDR
jgi:TetR/AcrR family transcriptional regulator, tetracycline repressor protein